MQKLYQFSKHLVGETGSNVMAVKHLRIIRNTVGKTQEEFFLKVYVENFRRFGKKFNKKSRGSDATALSILKSCRLFQHGYLFIERRPVAHFNLQQIDAGPILFKVDRIAPEIGIGDQFLAGDAEEVHFVTINSLKV